VRFKGGIYFEGGEDTPWGKKFAFHKREVREMIKASARMFIEEYNGDGLRFDSVHNMPWDLLQEITGDMRHRYPNKIKIAEVTPEHPSILHSAGKAQLNLAHTHTSCWSRHPSICLSFLSSQQVSIVAGSTRPTTTQSRSCATRSANTTSAR